MQLKDATNHAVPIRTVTIRAKKQRRDGSWARTVTKQTVTENTFVQKDNDFTERLKFMTQDELRTELLRKVTNFFKGNNFSFQETVDIFYSVWHDAPKHPLENNG